jgi:hypothetical protein
MCVWCMGRHYCSLSLALYVAYEASKGRITDEGLTEKYLEKNRHSLIEILSAAFACRVRKTAK